MNLFFETERQAFVFLAYVPLGFVTAMLLSLASRAARFRALLDVLSLLLCGLGLVAMLVLTRDEGLRLYQALALLVGAGLYALGLSRLLSKLARALQQLRKRKDEQAEQ